MKSKALHIVSFDIPYPANYGGVIDVYYKVKALSEVGYDVILHCFFKDRNPAHELKSICKEVHYYPREMNPYLMIRKKPFIVLSRKQPSLFEILMKDNYPVLFEGLHSTYFLAELKRAGKKCFVRAHNVEHEYYRQLAKAERSFLKRGFFTIEANKLKNYERILEQADGLIAISNSDLNHFKNINKNTIVIAPFHPEPEHVSLEQGDAYAFYHGNLEVPENQKAVKFLVEQVFSGFEQKLIIAGKSAYLLKHSFAKFKDVDLISDPSQEEMLKLATNAAVHVLPTFQSTGFKLKLIYSLYTAKSIIANKKMIEGTGMDSFILIANTEDEWKKALQSCSENSFRDELGMRRDKIEKLISNANLAEKLIQFLP